MKARLTPDEAIDLICRLEDLCKDRYKIELDINILKELSHEILEDKIRKDFRASIEALEPENIVTLIEAISDYQTGTIEERPKESKAVMQ